jgi:hypothetical protein
LCPRRSSSLAGLAPRSPAFVWRGNRCKGKRKPPMEGARSEGAISMLVVRSRCFRAWSRGRRSRWGSSRSSI